MPCILTYSWHLLHVRLFSIFKLTNKQHLFQGHNGKRTHGGTLHFGTTLAPTEQCCGYAGCQVELYLGQLRSIERHATEDGDVAADVERQEDKRPVGEDILQVPGELSNTSLCAHGSSKECFRRAISRKNSLNRSVQQRYLHPTWL